MVSAEAPAVVPRRLAMMFPLLALPILAAAAFASAGAGRIDCNNNQIPDAQDLLDWGTAFDEPGSWAAFDPGANGVGADPDGYWDAVFDGRYVYFVPDNNGTTNHGEVLRYDTDGDFSAAGSWLTYDPGAHGVGVDPDGYRGGAFDGRYVYFAPSNNGTDEHGEVLRFDTQGDFQSPASWATFDAGAHGVGTDPDGYIGAVFDGQCIYFVPYDNGSGHHAEILCYDTAGAFGDASSWATFNPYAQGIATEYGYNHGVFDGRYVYFAPNSTSDFAHHGETLRFDTHGAFTESASWAAFDAGDHGVGYRPDGYVGGAFDGRYIYFVPCWREPDGWHGEVMRYDTTGDFAAATSWDTFDAGDHGVGTDPDGYLCAFFDGRFITFVPCMNGPSYSGEFLRYDTSGDFQAAASWNTYDPGAHGVGAIAEGYVGGAFDGRFIYFAPMRFAAPHGEVMRYDIAAIGSPDCNGNGVPDECDIADLTSDDCNDNGVPDECDIAHGTSWDYNGNGIPDECENPCPADVNGDQTVNVLDLLAVLAAWGATGGPEDINADGLVNVLDLLAVLAAWGPC